MIIQDVTEAPNIFPPNDIDFISSYKNYHVALTDNNELLFYSDFYWDLKRTVDITQYISGKTIVAFECDDDCIYMLANSRRLKELIVLKVDQFLHITQSYIVTLAASSGVYRNSEMSSGMIILKYKYVYIMTGVVNSWYDFSDVDITTNPTINAVYENPHGLYITQTRHSIIGDRVYSVFNTLDYLVHVQKIDDDLPFGQKLINKAAEDLHVDAYSGGNPIVGRGVTDSETLILLSHRTPYYWVRIIGRFELNKKYLTDHELSLDNVLAILDYPNQEFTTNDAISSTLVRAHKFTLRRLQADEYNAEAARAFAYCLAAYWTFGSYAQSISRQFAQEDIGAYKANLMFLKDMVLQHAIELGINPFVKIEEDENTYMPAVIATGGSMVDV